MKLLRTQKVVYISCGEEHTAVLTKVRDSGVFWFVLWRFGAGYDMDDSHCFVIFDSVF